MKYLYGLIFCLCCCGRAEIDTVLDSGMDIGPVDEYAKLATHEERIKMIINKLEERGEFIIQMYMNGTPVELRSVNYDDDETKDLIFMAGIPGVTHQYLMPGGITIYLVDNAVNGFGKLDEIKIGRLIGGYLLLEKRKDVSEAANSIYREAVDLGSDLILYIDQMEYIRDKHGLDEESLKERGSSDMEEILKQIEESADE
jgi:hypothetical protein